MDHKAEQNETLERDVTWAELWTSRALSLTLPENGSFYFSPRKNISLTFVASATNDLHLLKRGALLSQPTAANENRIITLSSLFHSQTLKMKWCLCLVAVVSVGKKSPHTWSYISVSGLGLQRLRCLAWWHSLLITSEVRCGLLSQLVTLSHLQDGGVPQLISTVFKRKCLWGLSWWTSG